MNICLSWLKMNENKGNYFYLQMKSSFSAFKQYQFTDRSTHSVNKYLQNLLEIIYCAHVIHVFILTSVT